MADNPRIEELRRRVANDPTSIAFAALAEEYRRAGRFEEAIDTCRAGLARHPAYLSARVTLGRALLAANHLEDAQQELEYVLRAAPENLAAIRGLAEIHQRRGSQHGAEHYHAPLQVAPPPPPVAPPSIFETHEPTPPPVREVPRPERGGLSFDEITELVRTVGEVPLAPVIIPPEPTISAPQYLPALERLLAQIVEARRVTAGR